MGAPISQFETVESIRFFAALVSTEGIDQTAKDKANSYIRRLVDSMETSVNQVVATNVGLEIRNELFS